VIRIKQRFGLVGIAFITPVILSTPVGAFLADRFYKDKKKVILYLSFSTVFWALALYCLLYFFQDQVKGWLI
jgi:Sec-independent protein secretion pathway component TatC